MSVMEMLECADCGAEIEVDAPGNENDQGECVCEDCSGEYTECGDCGEIISRNSDFRDDHGHPICESCGEHYHTCDSCGAIVHDDRSTWIADSEELVCERCLENNYIRCEGCGRHVAENDSHGLGTGGRVCNTCYERGDYCRCADCGDLYYSSELNYDDGEDYCDDCFRLRQGSASHAIHAYGYKPAWIFQKTENEKIRLNEVSFFFGVELEVENTSGGVHGNSDTARCVKDLATVVCKQDGSIHDGFEIVFHPQTYAYATTDGREEIEDCLRELRERRFSGHNYGGMHIHVSLDAFSSLHRLKFHRLFRNARSIFTAISQRKPEKLEQWASFANLTDRPESSADRYRALNYTRHTVEVRIFNSTLRTDRFFKNLEAVKAAIDYSRQCGLQELDSRNFLAFIMRNRGIYRNLAAFLVEKCVNALSEVAVDVRVVRQVQKRVMRHAG